MPRSPQACRRSRRLSRRVRAAAGLTLLALAPGLGCGREFFRQWADQDVTEAIFEKSRDPRWRLPTFSIEPPPMSRFADPYDVDRPAAPPDDYAAEALSPVPQVPHIRTLTPYEGTGYLDMLNSGPHYDAPAPSSTSDEVDQPELEGTFNATPPEPAQPGPFTPDQPPGEMVPIPPEDQGEERTPILPEPGLPGNNSGPGAGGLTPNTLNRVGARGQAPARPALPTQARTRPAPTPPRDPGVQTVAFQDPAPASTQPGGELPQAVPGQRPPIVLPPEGPPAAPDTVQEPTIRVDPNRRLERPESRPVQNLNAPPVNRPDIPPEDVQQIQEAKAGFAGVLSPGYIDVNQATAAALPADSRPAILTAPQALQLALVNNRQYQTELENVYLSSLTVTLQRFAFQPQFYAGAGSAGIPGLGIPAGGSGTNSFLYRTAGAPGGQASTLSLSTVAGFGKTFVWGGRLLAGFANQTVFNFVGATPSQPTVQSSLPLSFVQPFLRGGGRAVTLEPLTLAERQLLYQVRAFARFRQTFMVSILTQNQAATGTGGGVGDPNTGFLQVLQLYQAAENQRRNVDAYDRAKTIYSEYAQGGASSGISQLQVDQIDQQLQQSRISLINTQTAYRVALDQFKQQIGMPPDTPLIIDRSLLRSFSEVFKAISEWEADPDHDPEDLNVILGALPDLENINLDGRPLFALGGPEGIEEVYADPERQEEFLLTAERIALENRLDLMNSRGQLYDIWRAIKVADNALLPVFTVTYNGNLITQPGNTNPFAFNSNSVQSQLSYQFDLPLVRLNERNTFRTALINYQRQRRALMQAEDALKLTIRTQARQLIQSFRNYDITKTSFLLALRQRDQALQQIVAPPGEGGATSQATQTLNFITSINSILQQQNTLIANWVSYQTQRIVFYRDLGILPFDEWEAYYELFPSAAGSQPVGAGGGDGAPPAPVGP